MSKKSAVVFWSILLTLAFATRVTIAFYWESQVRKKQADSYAAVSNPNSSHSNDTFFFGDSDSYWKLGRALAFGRPYQFDDERCWQVFRTPGYPAVLVPIFWIYGENPPTIVARIQGAIFGTLNVALVALLASMLFSCRNTKSNWIVPLSSCFFAFDPTLAFQSVLILSEESFLTFALLQNICLIDLAQKLGVLPQRSRDIRVLNTEPIFIDWFPPCPVTWFIILKSAVLLALTTAATIYLRPSWYYYLTFASTILLTFRLLTGNTHEIDDYHHTRYETIFSKRRIVFAVAIVVSFTYLSLSPWIIRNYKITNKFVPTTLQMGASLYDGLNPHANGASDMSFVDEFRKLEVEEPSGPIDEAFEVRLDARMKNKSLAWVKAHPFQALKLSFIKIYRLWAPLPREKAFASPAKQACLAISFIPIFVCGILGAIRSLRNKGTAWSLLIPAFYVTALHSIFVSSIRYRTPVLYGFSILAAYWLVSTVTTKTLSVRQKTRNNSADSKGSMSSSKRSNYKDYMNAGANQKEKSAKKHFLFNVGARRKWGFKL